MITTWQKVQPTQTLKSFAKENKRFPTKLTLVVGYVIRDSHIRKEQHWAPIVAAKFDQV
jgi:hypothetical protein